jgi:hypothetical protein
MNDCIKVGAKVRRYTWLPGAYEEVRAVGVRHFLAISSDDGQENAWLIDDLWLPYVEPVVFPEAWCVVFPSGVGSWFSHRETALFGTTQGLAVLHLCPDGTVEIERL